jgi:hypothetical protein
MKGQTAGEDNGRAEDASARRRFTQRIRDRMEFASFQILRTIGNNRQPCNPATSPSDLLTSSRFENHFDLIKAMDLWLPANCRLLVSVFPQILLETNFRPKISPFVAGCSVCSTLVAAEQVVQPTPENYSQTDDRGEWLIETVAMPSSESLPRFLMCEKSERRR